MTMPIYFHDDLVADIVQAEGREPALIYAQAWRSDPQRFPISLSAPLSKPEHTADVIIPWLMNLLPEGQPLRAMTRALGVAQEDVLALISETGRDLAGALTIGAPRNEATPDYRAIPTDRDLERIIAELPSRPFLIGEDGVSMSLAGAQEKLPVAQVGQGGLSIPINGAASTHILKPDNPRLPGSVQNEALCMVLARRCGLPVAPVTTGVAGERSYLLVERFDRAVQGDQVGRLHQEDFCQALGRPPAAKYQHNQSGVRGPSLPEMFALVREHMTARDITRLLDAVIFNIAIGNVDSHAKNYSILLTARGASLAPLYDLMSGLAWANITQNHAQDIGDQRRGRHVYRRHWMRMAQACGLAPPATARRVIALAGRVVAEIDAAADEVAAMPGGPSALSKTFVRSIRDRASLVQINATRDAEDGDDAGEAPPQTATYGDV